MTPEARMERAPISYLEARMERAPIPYLGTRR